MITPRQASRLAVRIVAEFDLDGVSVSLERANPELDPSHLKVVMTRYEGPWGEQVREMEEVITLREVQLLQSEYRAEQRLRARLEVAADVLLARADEISRYLGYGWENDSAYRTNLEGQRQAIQRLASELRGIARAKRKGDAPPKDRRPPRPPLPAADVKDPLTPPKLSPPARPSWPAPEQDPEVTAEDFFERGPGGVEEP